MRWWQKSLACLLGFHIRRRHPSSTPEMVGWYCAYCSTMRWTPGDEKL